MSDSMLARSRAAIAAIGPAVLLAAFFYHPHIGDLNDAAAVAAAAAADPTRWAVAHLGVGVGSALLLLAFLAARVHLRSGGEEPWSAFGVPFVVVGSTLFAMLPAMEFVPLVAAEIGADGAAAQVAVDAWFIPLLLIGSAIFAIGAVTFAIGVVRSRTLSPALGWWVAAALVLMAAARFVPLSAALSAGGMAGIAAFWPLGWRMWSHAAATPAAPASAPRTEAATAG